MCMWMVQFNEWRIWYQKTCIDIICSLIWWIMYYLAVEDYLCLPIELLEFFAPCSSKMKKKLQGDVTHCEMKGKNSKLLLWFVLQNFIINMHSICTLFRSQLRSLRDEHTSRGTVLLLTQSFLCAFLPSFLPVFIPLFLPSAIPLFLPVFIPFCILRSFRCCFFLPSMSLGQIVTFIVYTYRYHNAIFIHGILSLTILMPVPASTRK